MHLKQSYIDRMGAEDSLYSSNMQELGELERQERAMTEKLA